MTHPSARNSARYGPPVLRARTARLVRILVVVAFLAVVSFVGWRFAAGEPVKGDLVSYSHAAPDQVDVTFRVNMTPGTAATCSLQAMNDSRAQVGFLEVDIPPQTERRSMHSATISTQGEAASAEVVSCEVA